MDSNLTLQDVPESVDTDQMDLLARKVAIQKELLRLSKECGIAFYRPHYFQHLFHSSKAKRRGFFAANRVGKSKGNAAETGAWMIGERPWYKKSFDILGVEHNLGVGRRIVVKGHHDGGENHPLVRQGIPPWPTKQLIVCANWDKVDEIWTNQSADRPGKIWELVPRGFIKRSVRNHEGVVDELYGENGAMLKFMSVDAYKRNSQVAESSDYDRAGLDEPAPHGLWKGLSRGLVDRHGQGDFTLTSIEELWIYDYFNKDELTTDSPDACRDRWVTRATIWDNPYLTDESIAMFEADLDEEDKECRLQGIPLELSGLIYKTFKKEKHVLTELPKGWSEWNIPAKSCILHCRVDTHPVNPHAVMFAAVGPSEIPIICHEIYQKCDADELCELINNYVKMTGCFLGSLKVEPAAWINDPATKRASIASYFGKHGLFPTKAVKDLTTGINVVRAALRKDLVKFTPNCRRTFWEFSRYRYNPETGNPVDEEDHMMENLYRMIISPCRWFDPDKALGFPVGDEEFVHSNLSDVNY